MLAPAKQQSSTVASGIGTASARHLPVARTWALDQWLCLFHSIVPGCGQNRGCLHVGLGTTTASNSTLTAEVAQFLVLLCICKDRRSYVEHGMASSVKTSAPCSNFCACSAHIAALLHVATVSSCSPFLAERPSCKTSNMTHMTVEASKPYDASNSQVCFRCL